MRPTLVLALLALSTSAHAQTPAPKAQLPADQRAYASAMKTRDAAQRIAALQQFTKDFPKSQRVSRAQGKIFSALVENFPDRAKDIEAESKLLLHDEKGVGKWRTEMYQAFQMANAGTTGADLPYAEKIARDSFDHLNEAAFDKETAEYYENPKHLSAKDFANQHTRYATDRAETVVALGLVSLHQGKLAEARSLATQADALDPMLDDVCALKGEVALAENNEPEALTDFERAELLGALKVEDRAKVIELYKKAHNGSDSGLVAEMDRTYAELFPAPFKPGKHEAIANGHTALLELFTGSGCPPCVGGDLAVDALLDTYPRSEVVALAYDLHIPEPDPLTAPDTVARAAVYGVASTPSYVLDGTKLPLYGAERKTSDELYSKMTKAVDPIVAKPSAVQLHLTAIPSPDGTISVQATVSAPSLSALVKELTPPPTPPVKGAKPAPAATPQIPADPALIVNFALVEDDIRYGGENGVRFHRMVVRSLAKPAGEGFTVAPDSSTTAEAAFHPAEISSKLATYLDGYEQENDRFGPIHFLSKDTSIDPSHLAIAAWVQDSVTHRILQSAFISLGSANKAEGTR